MNLKYSGQPTTFIFGPGRVPQKARVTRCLTFLWEYFGVPCSRHNFLRSFFRIHGVVTCPRWRRGRPRTRRGQWRQWRRGWLQWSRSSGWRLQPPERCSRNWRASALTGALKRIYSIVLYIERIYDVVYTSLPDYNTSKTLAIACPNFNLLCTITPNPD
jgi:hypothetical protein